MSPETTKPGTTNPGTPREVEDLLRAMRQAYNAKDMDAYRSHFWTNSRFLHIDPSGRVDEGWGAFEAVLDQEFRYMDSLRLTLRNPQVQVHDDRFAHAAAEWRIVRVDPGGREQDDCGRATITAVRFDKEWKIVAMHFTNFEPVPE